MNEYSFINKEFPSRQEKFPLSAQFVQAANADEKEAPVTASTPYEEKPWLAHFEENVPEKVVYEEVCLPDFLERSAARFPNKMALLFQGYQMTFSQLKEMVDRFATVLTDFGVPNDPAR